MSNKLEKIEVNYRNKKRHKINYVPIRQSRFFTWLIFVLCKILLIGKKVTIQKKGLENLKGKNFLALSNHMEFIDFIVTGAALYPYRVSNVCDVLACYRIFYLIRMIGSITTRRYVNNIKLVQVILKCLKNDYNIVMYPEARYCASGITSSIPISVAKLVKVAKVPLVTIKHQGNHIHKPFWNFRKTRKIPLNTVVEYALTPEQIEEMSVEEIHEVIKEKISYNEYDYIRENGILIKEKYRAENLHKVLYKCPHCGKEHMDSKGTEVFCLDCGKRWNFNEDGTLSALDGEDYFKDIPSWYLWEKEEVRKEVRSGNYIYEDEVEVYGFPRFWRFIKIGKAKVRHTIEEGFVIEGIYRKKLYRILKGPLEADSLHVEYDFLHIKPYDCFDITNEDDSYYCYTGKRNVLTKLSLAVEEIYALHMERLKKQS